MGCVCGPGKVFLDPVDCPSYSFRCCVVPEPLSGIQKSPHGLDNTLHDGRGMLREFISGCAVDVVHVKSLEEVFSAAKTVRKDKGTRSVMVVSLTVSTESELLLLPDGAFGFWFKLPGMVYVRSSWWPRMAVTLLDHALHPCSIDGGGKKLRVKVKHFREPRHHARHRP